MPKARVCGLYALTPDGLTREDLYARCASALEGGARVLQLRDKTSSPAERLERAVRLSRLCREHGALMLVNDDVSTAATSMADGVHLGRDDAMVAQAREALGSRAIIGVSCYGDIQRAQAAVLEGADYVAFGSVFSSTIKPDAVRADLGIFARAKSLGVPLVAIGGITLDNAARVRDAGADAVAVITDLFEAPDIAHRAAQFARLFSGSGDPQ